jgi:mono/diheme cytochrome c family protein
LRRDEGAELTHPSHRVLLHGKVPAAVLAVAIFSAFWAVLGLVVFFVASRGGPAGARETLQTQSRGGRRAMALIFAVVYIGFGIALPLVFLTGNNANASSQVGGIKLTSADKMGRELFGQHCGVCHTLAAANAVGKVGPNLDTILPSRDLVLHTITNGCFQNPPPSDTAATCLGQGTMPANIVQGRQAQEIASFVAKVAGKG